MEYVLKASIIIAIFYGCYKLFLQRDTFFEQNRWFLLLGLITAFALPFVVIPVYIEYTPMPIENFVIDNATTPVETTETPIDIWQYVFSIYAVGVGLFFIRFCVQLSALGLLVFKNKKYKKNGYTVVETTKSAAPFSFFSWVVYNPEQFSETELQYIIAHEKVHVNQYHSLDIIVSQLAAIVLWCNPFMWFYKKDLQQNLEFIADFRAQHTTRCKKSYQHLLLKTSLPNQHMALTNNFYSSLIKKRIVMLHKSKSKKRNLLKYALVLPFLAIFLMGFNTKKVYVEKPTESQKEVLLNNLNLFKINSENTYSVSKSDSLKIIFNKDLTNNDLKQIKNQLKSENIVFTYSGLERNPKGEISKLKTKFETNGGHCTSNSDENPIKPFYFYKNKKGFGVVLIEAKKPIADKKNKKSPKQNPLKSYKVVITKDFKDADFKKAIEQGKKHGVTLNFRKIKRNTKGEIVAIHAEFKNRNGSGNYTLKGDTPIKPFAYSQSNDNFGFGGALTFTTVVGKPLLKSVTKDGKHLYQHRYSTKGDSIYILNNSTLNVQKPIVVEGVKTLTSDTIYFKSDHKLISSDSIYFVKKSANVKSTTSTESDSTKTLKSVFVTGYGNSNGKQPLYILDGNEITLTELGSINPGEIYSLNILKDEEQTKLYGKKAKDGVIVITTKKDWDTEFIVGKPMNSNKTFTIEMNNNNQRTEGHFDEKTGSSSLRGHATLDVKDSDIGLVFIDGKKSSLKKTEKLSPKNIESISILKGKKAIEKYGRKAKKGVIEITTKKKN